MLLHGLPSSVAVGKDLIASTSCEEVFMGPPDQSVAAISAEIRATA
jgi:hypothetical protein